MGASNRANHGSTEDQAVLRAWGRILRARGTTWTSRWCEVKHRVIDWVSRSLLAGEFEVVIMIEVVDRRDAWVGLSPDLENDYERELTEAQYVEPWGKDDTMAALLDQ